MKHLTKLIVTLVTASLLLSSCGGGGDGTTETTTATTVTTEIETTTETTVETTADTTAVETDEPEESVSDETSEPDFGTEEIVIDPDMAELAETDYRYKWIYAFLTGDTRTCEELTYVDEGVYEDLKNLRFSKYSITPTDEYYEQYLPYEQYLEFSFTVIEGIDTLPTGDYCYKLRFSGLWGIVWENITEEEESSTQIERPDIISRFSFCWCDMISKDDFYAYKEDQELWFQMFWTIYCVTPKDDWEAGITAEDIRRGGQLMFGIEDFFVDEKIAYVEDGKYRVPGRGGWGAQYTIESVTETDNRAEYIFQYYADRHGLAKSHKVKVTIEKTGDPVYEWCVKDVERLVEGKYGPYKYML